MDRRLLTYYNRELQHVREMGGEFAREFPKIAGRLGMDGIECADPYVERLLEGIAFLAARVQLKIDSEFPRFTQSLLETIYPNYLSPVPSMAIVQFEPDMTAGSLAAGFSFPAQTPLRGELGKGDLTRCEYRTSHDVTLWPIEIVEAAYHTQDLRSLDLPEFPGARAAIRIRLKGIGPKKLPDLPLDALHLHLRGPDEIPMRIYEQLIGHAIAVVACPAARPAPWHHVVSPAPIARMGFAENEALLPPDPRSFLGYRQIAEYFAFPQRFLFARLDGLAPAVKRCTSNILDIVVLLDAEDLELEAAVDAGCFALNCTPAVNLFPKRADRIQLSDRFSEFHVVPDRTRPLDFEVYRVLAVTGHGRRADEQVEFQPFYAASDARTQDRLGYFAVNRIPRQPSERERKGWRRSSYAGSETFISLVDAGATPIRTDLLQLGVETLCTNRDLAGQLSVGSGATDFSVDAGGPVKAIRCLGRPTPPRPSNAEGEFAWRFISHLSLNYLSIADADEGQGATGLRDILKLYADMTQAHIRKQVEGVRSISSRPITRRIAAAGPIAFARGLEVAVTLDDPGFEGTGVFLLGAVLENFFANYVTMNSFTETVIRSAQRGEVMRWPSRIGRRRLS